MCDIASQVAHTVNIENIACTNLKKNADKTLFLKLFSSSFPHHPQQPCTRACVHVRGFRKSTEHRGHLCTQLQHARGSEDTPPRSAAKASTMPFWGGSAAAPGGADTPATREGAIRMKMMREAEMRGFAVAAEACGKVRERAPNLRSLPVHTRTHILLFLCVLEGRPASSLETSPPRHLLSSHKLYPLY